MMARALSNKGFASLYLACNETTRQKRVEDTELPDLDLVSEANTC